MALSMVGRPLGLWALFSAGVLVWFAHDSRAQAPRDEYEVKAACLYFFFQHVEWPKDGAPGNGNTFVVGILGPDPFGDHLKALTAQEAKGKKIVVQHFATVKEFRPCHLLFVSSKPLAKEEGEDRLAGARAKTMGMPVLLVSDKEGLAEKGAVINMLVEKNFPKLEVNIDAEKRAGLKINARLLQLARIVRDAKEKP